MTAPVRAPGLGESGEPTSRGAPPVAVPEPTASELVERARTVWRRSLMAGAGGSALADVDRLGEAQLDLSAAHPSGIAQLFAGRPTHLSNLVREGSALSAAKRRARAVSALAEDHAQRYGLASAFLAIGVATWVEELTPPGSVTVPDDAGASTEAQPDEVRPVGGSPDEQAVATRTVRAPVLLRPVTIRPRGRGASDYDLSLEAALEVNPVLAAALRRRGALLDPNAVARGAFSGARFDPLPALERLGSLGQAVLTDFSLDDRLVVGTFVHPEQSLVDDLDAFAATMHEHEVVAALAGDQRSIDALAHPLPTPTPGDRSPESERGIGDLDPAQAYVVDVVAAGYHLLVDAPPGSDVAGTVAAVVADATAAGRTVLYVAGHRRAADAMTARMHDLGLDELVLDVPAESGWRADAGQRLLGAMTAEPVPVDAEKVQIVERELLDRRTRLKGYIAALHLHREPWGASAYEALQALARLTAVRPVPQTAVRLSAPVAEVLDAERRAQAATDLVRVATLGAFNPASRASAWYGADILTSDRGRTALRTVQRLLEDTVPRLREQATQVADQTGLTPARTPAEWTEQLQMLAGVRSALDLFRPIVFERSAADLVAATATKAWRAERGAEMRRGLRRRLRKQAKDMLRPGRPVADLHGALVEVQAQREVWQAHCPAGGWPRVPEGLTAIEIDERDVRHDLDALSRVVAGAPVGGALVDLAWEELETRLQRLLKDRATLETLPECTALVRSLDQRGLGDLLADLADRRVGPGVVASELELAWWTSVAEEILRQDPALAGYDGTALARLVAEFRTLDRRFLDDRALLARAAARDSLRERLRSAEGQTRELFGDIVEGRFTSLRHALERYPAVARHLRPCLVASPVLVPHLLPARRTEDLVVLDAAEHLSLETVVGALSRGRQVMVVADARVASGSAVPALAAVLPSVLLQAPPARRDPHLTAFLADHGRTGLTCAPLPAPSGLLRLDLVDGSGMPGPDGTVEGTAAEVARVAALVAEHALTHPEESLAVVTASAVHAERVREAVMAQVRDTPALGEFFRPDRAEPFTVTDLDGAQGLSRDATILSLGFGRTPHGRVLHRFGSLSAEGGDARLLEALGATRRRLTVVSCFGPAGLDTARLRSPGGALLAELLALAQRRTASDDAVPPSAPAVGIDPDRLVLDLAERLWRTGLRVVVDHAVPGGMCIPLAVGHPDVPDEMLVAVLTDDEDYVREPSVRLRDRQAPQHLERLGWTVVQVWSAAAFGDPEAEAEAVRAAVVEAAARRRAAGPEPPATETHAVATDDDAAAADPALPHRPPRPAVECRLPVSAYTDDQLDELAAWILTDGVPRDDEALGRALRAELGLSRRGTRIDAAVAAAVRRAR